MKINVLALKAMIKDHPDVIAKIRGVSIDHEDLYKILYKLTIEPGTELAKVWSVLCSPNVFIGLNSLGLLYDDGELQPQVVSEVVLTESFFVIEILKHPALAMVFTVVALLIQSHLFSLLAAKIFYTNTGHEVPYYQSFLAAFIFESAGIIISASYNDRLVLGISMRSIWLTIFFCVQILSDLCLFGIIKNPFFATMIVAMAMPIAILAYANLFMEKNRMP